ncbi:MAG: folate-binding protein YgfZ [Betaproteobacteria bacterium]|nr:folate-binding protein YgfZ [Betaproteobacteria bacterium]
MGHPTLAKRYELSRFGLLQFSGSDARAFLHAQLTCDVEALGSGRSTYGGYCTPKGRMLATFLLWRAEKAYFMQLPRELCEPIRKRLSIFILRSKVMVSDVSDEHVLFGLAGGRAQNSLREQFGDVPVDVHGVVHHGEATILHLPADRYELVVPAAHAPAVRETLAHGTAEAPGSRWDQLDIRAGVPVIMLATQEQFVPQMANLDLIGGLSYSKGCYPGQEIVARTHYLGRLKQRMYAAHISSHTAPQPGDRLYSRDAGEQASGMIVNAAPSPEGGYDVLAVIQISSAEAGTMHWKSLDGPALRMMRLPYSIDAA